MLSSLTLKLSIPLSAPWARLLVERCAVCKACLLESGTAGPADVKLIWLDRKIYKSSVTERERARERERN